MSETIYVATEAHVAQYRHGGNYDVPAGFWVSEGHELMKTHPEKWRVGARPQEQRDISQSSVARFGDRGGSPAVLESSDLIEDVDAARVLDGDEDGWDSGKFKSRDEFVEWLKTASLAPSLSEALRTSVAHPDVELRANVTPSVVVRLMPAAQRDLYHEAQRSRPRMIAPPRALFERGDYELGVESAAYLFGRLTGNVAVIDVISGTGVKATPTSVTFEPGDAPARAIERELRDVFDVQDTRLIGDAHTHIHPNDRGTLDYYGQPSDGDLRAWGMGFGRIEEERGASQYLGLVGVTEGGGDGGAFGVTWYPWLVSRSATGRLVCEPAAMADR